MKRLFFVLIAVLLCFVSFGQRYYNKTESDDRYNKVIDNINPHDSVYYKYETYHKDTIDSKLGEKANLISPAFTGTPTAPTAMVGINTTQVATTAFVYQAYEHPILKTMKALGVPAVAIPSGASSMLSSSGSALTDGRLNEMKFEILTPIVVTGFKAIMTVLGVYTPDNYNGFAIFSISGGVATLISKTVDQGTLWSSSGIVTKALPEPITLQPGLYSIQFIYNSSAQTTAPSMAFFGTGYGSSINSSMKLASIKNTQTDVTTPVTLSTFADGSFIWGVWLY